MKPEKAIVGSQEAALFLERKGLEEWTKAVRLSIEALKAYRKAKQLGLCPAGYTLPGETKD